MIFQSFQSGNLKQLDLEFYLKLRLPTTKRMYRFLDKRFYRRSPAGLRPADAGLRAHRPEPVLRADRAQAAAQAGPRRAGAARVPGAAQPRGAVFVRQARHLADHPDPGRRRGRGRSPAELASEPTELVDVARRPRRHGQDRPGTRRDATPRPAIRTKLEVFDWLIRNEDKRVGKNPAGYLVASIRSDYQAPGDYQSPTRRGRDSPWSKPSVQPSRPSGKARPTPRPRPSATRPARPSSGPPGSSSTRPIATPSSRPSRPRIPA